ncbi:rhamnogalacturonan acetylesterase [Gorillibacterium sp. sgz5001074]|uniref:rhamnogalacturonan acetylesterase n=1 Tax=Gorillibacterium sp. sgz5001074 TaxID=3446695 RepID=UPI003F66B405
MNTVTLYLASDSTCQNYDEASAPLAGWGMFLGEDLLPSVRIVNRAIGGRSSKSFIVEGRLEAIREEMAPGDWLFIQMGHNDSTKEKPERYTEPFEEYKGYLKQYIQAARERGAHPLLITPVARLHWDGGQFVNDFPDYCRTMKQLAEEEQVPLVDLMERSLEHWTAVGFEEARTYFMVSVNGTDHTHFTERGARAVAALLAQEIRELRIGLSACVREPAGVQGSQSQ